MDAFLRSRGVTDVFVCGIAYDVCVGETGSTYTRFSSVTANYTPLLASTAFHGQELGFRTVLIDDCSRGIITEAIHDTIRKVHDHHGVVVKSTEVTPSTSN